MATLALCIIMKLLKSNIYIYIYIYIKLKNSGQDDNTLGQAQFYRSYLRSDKKKKERNKPKSGRLIAKSP